MTIQRCGARLLIGASIALWSIPQAAAQAAAQASAAAHHVRVFVPQDGELDSPALARMLSQELPATRWQVSPMSSALSFKEQLLLAQELSEAEGLSLVAWISADGQLLHLYSPYQDDATRRLSSRAMAPPQRTHARQLMLILQQLLPSLPKTSTPHHKPAQTLTAPSQSPKALPAPAPIHQPPPLSVHINAGVGLIAYSSTPTIRYLIHARATLFTLTYLGVGLYADWLPQVPVEGVDHSAHLGHRAIAIELAHRWLMSSGELVLSLGIGAEHTQGRVEGVLTSATSRWAAIAIPSLKWRHRLTAHTHAQVEFLTRINPRAQRYYYGPLPSQLVPRWRIAPALTLGVNAHWP